MGDVLVTDDVIPFPGSADYARNRIAAELDELPVRTDRSGSGCDHRRIFVNEAARTLVCRDCDVPVDPIEALAKIARDRERYVFTRKQLRSDIERLQERLGRLERDEANAKARIRRAEKRAS